MSQAIPTRSGGAGTRRLRVLVKGSAVGTAPAARWALPARALPMRRRPGGTLEVTVTVSRPPAVASRSARVRRRAAAASSSRGSRVPVIARGRVCLPKTSRAARSALPRDGLLVLALVGGVGREGGRRRGEVGGDRLGEYLDGAGEGLGELGGDLDDQGGGRGLVGVEAEDAAPAAGEGYPGAQVVVGDRVELAPGGPQPAEASVPMAASTLGGDRGGLVGLEDAGVLAGEQEGGGGAGLAGA